MTDANRKTLKSVLESAILYLQECGIEDAARDAWLLMEYVSGMNHSTYYANSSDEMDRGQYQRFRELLEKRGSHIPLQYLTGEAWFYGLCFHVNEHVLIPRQDTEVLVEEALSHLSGGERILDLCTGSGCILTAILHETPGCTGTGADISPEALEIAAENAAELGERAQFVKSDLFRDVEGSYDLIVSNPPYIRTQVIEELMPEVKDHEPRIALDGKEDGLYFYRRIISDARGYLKEGGYLCVEIGYDQGQEVRELMEQSGYTDLVVRRDLSGLDRVVSGRKGPV
ncbi:MAG: peptide chain release factor N(5)-glutamine methyltransferase [Fusicatenibacter sp.]|nr:peptide chain release factor N(5)-glutamine methyltransferase [Lachnospiraceae bacterium]MDY2937831.1 peptide chain release factor N(5)-glutamine methyltransferase [Fusicatenibacter sp.]